MTQKLSTDEMELNQKLKLIKKEIYNSIKQNTIHLVQFNDNVTYRKLTGIIEYWYGDDLEYYDKEGFIMGYETVPKWLTINKPICILRHNINWEKKGYEDHLITMGYKKQDFYSLKELFTILKGGTKWVTSLSDLS